MTDRYFENFMQTFIEEASAAEGSNQENESTVAPETETKDSLQKLLSMPYADLSVRLKRAAGDLKETIVAKTFINGRIHDFTLYTGALGTAFLLFKSFQVTGSIDDLELSSQIIKACDLSSARSRHVAFIYGRGGVCALGAVVAKNQTNPQMLEYYLTQFKQLKLYEDQSDGMLNGRAGYLWACLFLHKNLGYEVIPSTVTDAIVNKIVYNGRKLGLRSNCPLMYMGYGRRSWGAAHGVSGVIYVLLHFNLTPDVIHDIKKTLRYMINNKFPSGNYPTSEEDKWSDARVHWCHGAPGIALTLAKAAEVFEEKEFLEAAIDAGEVVWTRGLLKRAGVCHGISGNAYVFLSLYRLTGDVKFLYRAKAFGCFLLDRGGRLLSEGKMYGGDNRYSLFEGIGGMAYFFLDLADYVNARFPGHEL